MKKFIGRVAALVLCAGLCLPAIPARAAYTPEEVALSLRPVSNGDYAVVENTAYLTTGQAEEGASVHMGVYLEADHDDVLILALKLVSENENITFNEESYYNPTASGYTSEPVTYTLSDGTSFSTTFKPFCFGSLTAQGTYKPNCFGVETSFRQDENALLSMVMNTTTMPFFGGSSDELSYIEFDVDIAPGTPAGVYDISFVHDADEDSLGHTYISSDNGAGGYDDVFPTLENASIVISDEAAIVPEQPVEQYRSSDDREAVPVEVFFPEDAQVLVAENGVYRSEPLDRTQLTLDADAEWQYMIDEIRSYSVLGNLHYYSEKGELFAPYDCYMEMEEMIATGDLDPAHRSLFTMLYKFRYRGVPLSDGSSSAMGVVNVGLRGDANGDAVVDAEDASKVLAYAANRGSGKPASLTGAATTAEASVEKMYYFLADVVGQSLSCGEDGSMLDATDASTILLYAARIGAGVETEWSEVMGE